MKYLFEWLDERMESGRAYLVMEWDTLSKNIEMFTEIHPEIEHYQVYRLDAPVVKWMDTVTE